MTILEDQIRECFGRVVYTHKTHEKMADRCANTLRRMKITQILLTAITTGGALAIVLGDGTVAKILTLVVSLASFILSAYLKGFDPGGAAQKHREAGASLWDVRESYLSLLTDLLRGALTEDEAAAKRDELQERVAKIYTTSPHTTGAAYADAQKALKEFEDYTFSAAEIDAFLPNGLKKDPP